MYSFKHYHNDVTSIHCVSSVMDLFVVPTLNANETITIFGLHPIFLKIEIFRIGKHCRYLCKRTKVRIFFARSSCRCCCIPTRPGNLTGELRRRAELLRYYAASPNPWQPMSNDLVLSEAGLGQVTCIVRGDALLACPVWS